MSENLIPIRYLIPSVTKWLKTKPRLVNYTIAITFILSKSLIRLRLGRSERLYNDLHPYNYCWVTVRSVPWSYLRQVVVRHLASPTSGQARKQIKSSTGWFVTLSSWFGGIGNPDVKRFPTPPNDDVNYNVRGGRFNLIKSRDSPEVRDAKNRKLDPWCVCSKREHFSHLRTITIFITSIHTLRPIYSSWSISIPSVSITVCIVLCRLVCRL